MKRKDWWKLHPFATGFNIRAADGKGRRKTDLSKDELRDLQYGATIAAWLAENPAPTRPIGSIKPTISDREHDPEWIQFSAGGRMIMWYGSRTMELRLHNSRDFTVSEWDYVEHLSCRLSPYGKVVLTGRVRVSRPAPLPAVEPSPLGPAAAVPLRPPMAAYSGLNGVPLHPPPRSHFQSPDRRKRARRTSDQTRPRSERRA